MLRWIFMSIFLVCPAVLFAGELTEDIKVKIKEENLRAVPNGEILGVLNQGSPMQVVDEKGNWVKVQVEGWIWRESTTAKPLPPAKQDSIQITTFEGGADVKIDYQNLSDKVLQSARFLVLPKGAPENQAVWLEDSDPLQPGHRVVGVRWQNVWGGEPKEIQLLSVRLSYQDGTKKQFEKDKVKNLIE